MAVDYATAVVNFYKHEECGTHWADIWSCGCNDKCPRCSAEIESYLSIAASDVEAISDNL